MIAPLIREPRGPSPQESYYYNLLVKAEHEGEPFYAHQHGMAEQKVPQREAIRAAALELVEMFDNVETPDEVILYLDWLSYDQHIAVCDLMDVDDNGKITPEEIEKVAGKESIYPREQ